MEELSSIVGSEDRIREAISFHNHNELIFVVPEYVYQQNPVKIDFQMFLVKTNISGFDLGRKESREFFDTNQSLIDYLVNNYPIDKRKDNLIFDLRKELDEAEKYNRDKEIDRLKTRVSMEHDKQIKLLLELAEYRKTANIGEGNG